jgi:predicted RND superfamily exporter protein
MSALLLFFVWALQFSRLELDIYDVYDPGFPGSVDLAKMRDSFGDNSQMLLTFKFKHPPESHELCTLQKWTQNLARYKEIKSITSPWSLRKPRSESDNLWYPKVLNDPCETVPSQSFSLREKFGGTFFDHLISSKNDQDIVFDVTFNSSGTNTDQVERVMQEARGLLKEKLPDTDVSFLGLSSSRYYFRKIIIQDSIFTLLIIPVMMVLLRLIYGTWTSGFYLVFTLVASTIALYGALAITGIPVDILTNNLFLMTAVAGTADFMFVSHAQLKGNYQDSYYNLITPCFFTTLTTVVGFLSLNTSDLDIIRNFGNGAAFGAMAEWIMLFIFMPGFLKLIGKEKVWVNPEKAVKWKLIPVVEKMNLPRSVLWIMNVLLVLSVPSFFFLNDQDSPVKNLPASHEMRTGYEDFKKNFLWEGQVYLYFPTTPEKQELNAILSKIKASPLVFKIENPEELANEWTEGLPPLRQDLIRRELSMTPLWARYYSNDGQLRIPLYLYEQDLHSLRKVRDLACSVCKDDCRLAGQRVVYLEYGEKISKTMIESFAVSIFLVVGILFALLKSVGKQKFFFPVVISALMGPLVILSLIAIFQVPVTLVTSIFLAVMVGMAGDNAIQYMLSTEDDFEKGIESRASASIYIALVMIAGSSLFLFQSLLPMQILGGLFVTGFLINVTGDYWGLKGLLGKNI